ncbi:hypothetical protein NDU88_003266 [Pleurodeles waltl]|uniref:Uncharacterized protein n=1 Tax=Pleurodeles waltl TaxID=8319 RepID=A0AAV7LGL8_PLEWA|nr:hypothetical protein NDU88_003266 [Pleurodeles waltl]
MLQSIYDSTKELQTETRAESRWARMGTQHLQGTVPQGGKIMCGNQRETKHNGGKDNGSSSRLEALRLQTAAHDGQLPDIMWKLEDQETRQRRNNLRFLGIREGAEENDIRPFMIKMLRDAFPELTNWD